MSWRTTSLRALALPAVLAALALFAAACGGGSDATPTSEARNLDQASPATEGAASADSDGGATTSDDGADAEAPDFPTGEAVLVAADYQHPSEFVDNTGAYLPANGKPTVVFVDAIW